MRLFLIHVIGVLSVSLILTEAKTSKKSIGKQEVVLKRPKPSANAIIAIEIVDPADAKSKNSKRTIDSALGYGYHNSPPRYEVYKYNRDIPPYQGPHQFFRSQGIRTHNYDVQKSISYQLPQQQFYHPGTTLFSTINAQGNAAGLTSQLPQEPHVPVIILRVYPNQLNDPSAVLHPNLPQDHPLAATINSINVQDLLVNYMRNLLQQQPDPGLLTYENYPKDTHTRVVFKKPQSEAKTIQSEVKTIQVQLPSDGRFSGVEVETPDMHYSYGNSQNQDYYYQPQQQATYQQGQEYQDQNYQDQSYQDQSYQDQNYQDENYQDQNYQDQTYQDQNYQDQNNQDQNYQTQNYQDQNQNYQDQNYYQYDNSNNHQQSQPSSNQQEIEHTTPYNYHAHQKRSKKPKIEDIRLEPIKAA